MDNEEQIKILTDAEAAVITACVGGVQNMSTNQFLDFIDGLLLRILSFRKGQVVRDLDGN